MHQFVLVDAPRCKRGLPPDAGAYKLYAGSVSYGTFDLKSVQRVTSARAARQERPDKDTGASFLGCLPLTGIFPNDDSIGSDTSPRHVPPVTQPIPARTVETSSEPSEEVATERRPVRVPSSAS
jgi:hypothetical protein